MKKLIKIMKEKLMKKNHILSLILAVMMLVSVVFPTGIYAEEITEQEPVEVVAVEETVAEEPAVEELAAEEPAAEEAAVEEPAVEEAAEEEPAAEEPAAEEPAAEEPAAEEPAAEEPAAEEAAEEEPAAEEPATEEPAEEEPATEEPAVEEPAAEAPVTEKAAQEAVFENGYVRIQAGTVAYKEASKKEEAGSFSASAVVYAFVVSRVENEANNWLRITFDTASEDGLKSAYVQFKDVRVLSEAETAQLVAELGNTARQYQDNPLPVVSFQPAAEVVEETEEEAVVAPSADASTALPVFTVQPQNVTVPLNGKVTFTANAGDATYQWQYSTDGATWKNLKNGTTYTGADTNSLSFSLNAYRATCQYRVIASNAGGETPSVVVTATIGADAPKFTVQPQSVTAALNGKVTFTANAGDVTYQWQYSTDGTTWKNLKNGTTYTGADTKSLSFSLNAYRATCQYRVVASNAGGETPSVVVTATIGADAPKFTVQPESVTVALNGKVTFTANAGDVTYQWQYSTDGTTWKNLKNGTTYTGADTKSLSFNLNAYRATCQYRVIASNAGGETPSAVVTATIGGSAPEFTVQPESVTVALNGEVTFTANAGDATYQWQYSTDGTTWKNLKNGTTYTGADTNSLSFKLNAYRATCQYRVIASNASGETPSAVVTATIGADAPEFTVQPESVTVPLNETVTFTADAGDATYQWQYSTDGATWKNLKNGTTYTGADTKSLSFKLNAYRATCQYRVIASNAGGETPSAVVTATIGEAAPEFTVQPESVTVRLNETVTFTADAGEVTYQWQYSTDGATWKNLKNGTTYTGVDTKSLSFSLNAYRATCQYRVVASNDGGETPSDVVTATIDNKIVVDDVTYEAITATTCKVFSYAGSAASLVIPSEIEGMTVVEIGEEAFMGNATLTSIDLPNTITVIRARAFKNCSNLSEMKNH
jgi:chemotaxis protein histidine kinase CheA